MNPNPRLSSLETQVAVMKNEIKSLKEDDMSNLKEWVKLSNDRGQRFEDNINEQFNRFEQKFEQKIDQLGNTYFNRYTTIASLMVAFISILIALFN